MSWWLVVLNWNGRDDTLACLDSLAAVDGAPPVVVVDNGSVDGSVEAIRAAHPGVPLIETGANLGFSGGNNAGIRHALDAGAEWVVLVNNDATLRADCVTALQAEAAAHPEAGVLSGKLFFADPPGRIWFAGQGYNTLTGYAGRPYGYGKPDAPEYSQPREVDRAAGALMAVSRAAIDAAGLLDEGLFAYVEDVDWCLRIRAAGFTVRLAPERRRLASRLGLDRRRARIDARHVLRAAQHGRRVRAPPAAAPCRRAGCAVRSSWRSSPRSRRCWPTPGGRAACGARGVA